MDELIAYAIPFFVVLMLLEYAWLSRSPRRRGGYEPRDTAASLSMGLANVIISGFTKGAVLVVYTWAWQYRLFDWPDAWWVWPIAFLGDDLCYYAFHRTSHEVRVFWAAHVNHHSSRRYNLSTALRQSWTTPVTGPIFWLPLALLGIPPLMIFTAQAVSLLYQFWIHTEAIDRMGPLEWIFNTPSHHRVHHARNVPYLDKNYAGILIIWDRLFGSFEPERDPCDYGLTSNITTFNPVHIAFHEWRSMIHDAWHATSWREAFGHVLRPPGWSPDGSTHTARELQRALG